MIKLQEEGVLVREGAAVTAHALDEWRILVQRCCRATGFSRVNLADDVAEVVRRFCAMRASRQQPAAVEEVDALVVQLLLDSGLHEVAARFQHERQVLPPNAGEDRLRLAAVDLTELLRADPFFLNKPLDSLIDRLRQALESLSLRFAGAPFIQALAREIWWQMQVHAEPAEREDAPFHHCWLISPEQMQVMLAEHAGDALLTAGLRVKPVSRLLPTLAAELPMARLATELAGKPPTELALLPAFDQACRDLATLIHRLCAIIDQRVQSREPGGLPVRLTLQGIESLTGEIMPMPPRQATAFRDELAAIAGRALQPPLNVRILLS